VHTTHIIHAGCHAQLYNAPRGMMTSYQETLDALMRKAVDDSERLNSIQLVILAVEGVVVGTLSVIIVWFFASKVRRPQRWRCLLSCAENNAH
jgi:hypothetical protein